MKVFIYACVVIFGVFVQLHEITAARCDGIPGGTLLIHSPDRCNQYYACQHEVDHEWYCPPGEFFNPRNQQCEPTCPNIPNPWCAGVPDGIFIRVPPTEPADCTRYYTCVGGEMFPHQCPPGFLFSQRLQACGFNPAEC